MLSASIGAAETNRTSFTNLTGRVFLNVTVIKTNEMEIVFKEAGKLGFFTEKLTNLPERVQWQFRAQERERAEELKKTLTRAIDLIVRRGTETIENEEKDLRRFEARREEPLVFEGLIQECAMERRTLQEIIEARTKDTPADKIAALRELVTRFAGVEEKAEAAKLAARARKKKEVEIQESRSDEELFTLAKRAVEWRLVAPTTAAFTNLWVARRDGYKVIHGEVAAQNLFGAMLSKNFEVYANRLDAAGIPESGAVYFSSQELAKEVERIWK